MFSQKVIDQFSRLAERQGWDYVTGSLCAAVESEGEVHNVGQVELVVASSGNYLMWYFDADTDTIKGIFQDGSIGQQRIVLGPKTTYEEKLAVVNGISARVCE